MYIEAILGYCNSYIYFYQGDANTAAEELQENINDIEAEKKRIIQERREKARLRHKYARDKELLKLVSCER